MCISRLEHHGIVAKFQRAHALNDRLYDQQKFLFWHIYFEDWRAENFTKLNILVKACLSSAQRVVMENDNETLGLVPSLGLTIQNLLTEAYNLVVLVNLLLWYLAASVCELCNDLQKTILKHGDHPVEFWLMRIIL